MDRDLIRSSHTIMLMSGYTTPAQRRMYRKKKEDTANLLVRKTMSRNTFYDVIRFTHYVSINKAAEEYIEKAEYSP
ncbi:hypothetical protein Pcinc_008088 [Petrolisthes cinctipes]|uniref:Uncharacterized protein n=1 Tax=Petrolisthes cinctipes TaxID=88211 RepID=A0AAE1G9N2_PETCI|nr:hypothetical protein Pcinc_008088 [Petrolisthes cinctipes]